jgi:outer membrane receptor for ferrienterochelin and colicins
LKPIFVLPLAFFALSSAYAQERVLAEVTVNATGSEIEERRQSATQKTIIDRQGIEATGGLYIGEVLSKLPGIDAGIPSSDGSVALRSRGMVRDSVQVLIDGERPAGDARHALMIVARMPAGELERVEIMKGATAEFGSSTPVTVNLVTNKAKRNESLTFKVAGGARGDEPVAQLSLTKTGSSGAWSWSIPLSISQTRSPIEKELTRKNATAGVRTLWQNEQEQGRNEFSEIFFGPKLSWKEGQSSFSVWPMLFMAKGEKNTTLNRQQFADPVLGTGAATVLQRTDKEDSERLGTRLRMEGETLASGSKLSGRLTLANSDRNSDVTRIANASFSTEAYRRNDNEVNAALRADRGWGDHVSAIGLEYVNLSRTERQSYTGGYTGKDTFRAEETQATLWLQDEWAIAKAFTVTAGLRGESIGLSADTPSKRFGMLSPSISGRWEFSEGWLLRSSLGTGIKAPKLDEISDAPVRSTSANSPLEPDRRGNPNLHPEKSTSLDMAIEHYWPNEIAVVGFNAYIRDTTDFVERRSVQEGARWVERPYNEGDARHWGVELDGKIKTELVGLSGGSLRTHLTLPHGTVEDRRLGLSRSAREVPRYIWTFGYDQTLASLSSNAGFLLQQTGKTETDVPAEQWAETKTRSVLDAYWVRKVSRTINLRLTLQNILGDDSRRTTRAYSGGQDWQLGSVENQPRSILLTLEGKW